MSLKAWLRRPDISNLFECISLVRASLPLCMRFPLPGVPFVPSLPGTFLFIPPDPAGDCLLWEAKGKRGARCRARHL